MAPIEHPADTVDLHVPPAASDQRAGRGALVAKRIVDVVGASVGLLLALPILVATAVAVRLTSPGPILFRQQRVGRYGVPFTILKFRSLRHGIYEEVVSDPELWAIYVANEHKLPPAIAGFTPIGKFIRAFNIDELPQLVNVLRGDMSLVGVRPIEASQLALRPPSSQACYRAMRPGLTGAWQVHARPTANRDARIALDDSYVRDWSFVADLRLLALTPLSILRMRHAT